jgi:hypothetical protein
MGLLLPKSGDVIRSLLMICMYTNRRIVGFDVENIQPIIWPLRERDPMSALILDDSDKDVVKALVRKYSRGQATWGGRLCQGERRRTDIPPSWYVTV